jgi:hypothetical protein
VVEAEQRVRDDEDALGEAPAVLGKRDGGLERRRVVVGEVPDRGDSEPFDLLDPDEPRAAGVMPASLTTCPYTGKLPSTPRCARR